MSEKEIKIKHEIRELADKFKAVTEIEKDGSSNVTSDVFIDTLGDGLTKDIVEAVYDHRDNCVKAGQLAAGELFVDAMAKNNKMDRGTVSYGLGGKDQLNVIVDRTRSYPGAPGSADSERVTKFGVVSATLDVSSTSNTGDVKKIRTLIAQYGLEHLK